MNYKKIIAGMLAVSMLGSGAFLPNNAVSPLSDSVVMNANAAGTDYSCDSFDFDASTGTMTLKGNVSVTLIRHFTQKENVKSVTAQKGTVFPSDCSDMFYDYSNVTSFDLSNVDTSNMTETTYMFYGCSKLGTIYVNGSNSRAIKNAVHNSGHSLYRITFIDDAIEDSCESFDFDSETGIMTLRGNVNNEQIRNFSKKENVKSVTAEEGTVLSGDCCGLFSRYTNTESINLANVDTSSVTDMSGMFYHCHALSALDVSSFDTSNVTDMSNMFALCYSLTSLDLSNFDTGNVTNMDSMFYILNISVLGESKLESLNISSFDTSNVTNMSNMFGNCSKIRQLDLSSFDTSKVTNMSNMFSGCKSLFQVRGISGFDTSNVTNMSAMFRSCAFSSLNVMNFDTSNVTDMSYMFYGDGGLQTLELGSFDTSKVTDMSYMFKDCESLLFIDLTGFHYNKTVNKDAMFTGCSSLIGYMCSTGISVEELYISSESSNLPKPKSDLNRYFVLYREDFKNKLSRNRPKSLIFGKKFPEYESSVLLHLYEMVETDGHSYQLYKSFVSALYSPVSLATGLPNYETMAFAVGGIDTKISLAESDCTGYFKDIISLETIDLSGLDTSNITVISNMFEGCTNLKSIDFTECDLSNVTDMTDVFKNCSSLSKVIECPPEIAGQVIKLTPFGENFGGWYDNPEFEGEPLKTAPKTATSLYARSSEDTHLNAAELTKAINESGATKVIFCKSSDQKPENAEAVIEDSAYYMADETLYVVPNNVGKLIAPSDCSYMFNGMTKLTEIDCSGLDTSAVTDMSNMFTGCTALERIDMSMLNTSNVQSFRTMFSACSSLKEVKLSGLITSSATNISMMFANCSSLKKVDLSNSDITNCTNLLYMFRNAPVEEIACTQAEYNTYVKNGSLKSSAVRVDKLCIADARFQSTAMTLGGSISLNFYSELTGVSTENLSKTYAEFEVNGKKQTVKFDPNNRNTANTRYGFTCMLNSVSMADDVKATLYYYDEYGIKHSSTVTSNVQSYLKKAAANTGNTAKTISLTKAINDYGYYMQKFLSAENGWTIGTEHSGMETAYKTAATYQNNKSAYLSELAGHKVTKSVVSKDISGASFNLTLDSDTAMNFKVTPAAGYTGKITITIDGKAATATKLSDGKYQVTIPNISAHQLGDIHTITIKTTNGTSTYKLSALTYSYNAINSSSTTAEKYNAASALYEYYKAAIAYRS